MPHIRIPTAVDVRDSGQTPQQQYSVAAAAHSAHWDAICSIMNTSQIEGRALKADEQRAYDEHDREMTRLVTLQAGITAAHPELTKVDRSELAPPLGGPAGGAEYREGAPLAKGQTYAGFVRAQQMVPEEHENLSWQKYLRGMVTGNWRDAGHEMNAMTEGTLSGGGYAVPTLLSSQIIDLARNQAALLRAGTRIVPMANRTVDIAKWTGDPAPAWHTENALITATDGTMSKITLTAKALAGITWVSRELLEDAQEVENELRAAFAAQFALTVDKAGLYGSGTDPEPRGLKNAAGVNKVALGGANGSTPGNYDWLVDAAGRLADVNESAQSVIYSPRTARTLGKLKDTTNQPMRLPDYVAELERYQTNQVGNALTVGTSTDTSDAFVGDFSQLYLGVRTQLQIQVLTERNADFGQVGFLTWWRGDIQVARPAAFDITTGLWP